MCKKEILILCAVFVNLLANAQAHEEISCEAYYSERAYFGTAQRPITIENKTDRTLKLVYKNGEQEEFDIMDNIPPGQSISARVFNNATLSVQDLRSGACVKALRLNPEDATEIKVEIAQSKVLKEIAKQDPATGKDILKIDCEYIKEEFQRLNGRGSISMTNKTDGPMAVHRIQSGVGKVGRPFAVMPPTESKTFNYMVGDRFMLKDKTGQCVGVYEVLGDATITIDKKELTKDGAAPFVWEESNENVNPSDAGPGDQTYAEIPKEGLALWMKADSGVNVIKNRVSSWRDLSGNGRHANQRHWKYAPIYVEKGLNNRPALYFSRSYLKTDGSFLVGKEYTIFVVHHYHRQLKNNFLLTGGEALPNQGLSLGYHMGKASQSHGENKLEAEIFGHHINKATVMTFRQSAQQGRTLFVNDEMIGSGTTVQDKEGLIALKHLAIGGYKTLDHFFTGPIAEIVIYDRSLSPDKITEIQESLMGQYGLGQKIPNQLEDPTLLTREAPNNYQPILLDLPKPAPLQTTARNTNANREEANPALLSSLKEMGIDIPANNLKLWLKAEKGVETSPLDARSQSFVDRGMLTPAPDVINYVDRWADQSGNGNDATAVPGLSHFRPALANDGSDTPVLRFGMKRVRPASGGLKEMQFMIGQKLKVPTTFLNQSNYTLFIVHRPTEDIPEGSPHGTLLANQGSFANKQGSSMLRGDGRLVYGYTNENKNLALNTFRLQHDRPVKMLGNDRYTGYYQELPMNHTQKQILTVQLDTIQGTTVWITGKKLIQTLNDSHPMFHLDTLLIGSGPENGFSGDIFEILMYDQALSAEEMEQVNQYLTGKHQINTEPLSLRLEDFRFRGLKSFNALGNKDTIRAATYYVDFPDHPGGTEFPEIQVEPIQSFYDQKSGGRVYFESIVHEKTWNRSATRAPAPNGTKVPNGEKIQELFAKQSRGFDLRRVNVTHTVFPEIPDYSRANVNGMGRFTKNRKFGANISLGNGVRRADYHKTMIHEYGHVFGLPDLYYEDDKGTGPEIVNTNAVGAWSLMADAFGSKNFLQWELYYLGWFSKENMKYVTDQTWQGELKKYGAKSGTTLLIIPEDESALYQTSFYCIEVPEKPNPDYMEGVLVYYVDTSIKTSLLPIKIMKQRLSETYEAPLRVGEELSLEEIPFTVKVLNESNDGYKIGISRK